LDLHGSQLEPEDRQRLKNEARDLEARGMPLAQAERVAVRRMLEDVNEDLADIRKQLQDQGAAVRVVPIIQAAKDGDFPRHIGRSSLPRGVIDGRGDTLSALGELFDQATQKKFGSEAVVVDIIDEDQVKAWNDVGLPLKAGTQVVVTADSIRHALKRHGAENEKRDDQIPITRDDIIALAQAFQPELLKRIERRKNQPLSGEFHVPLPDGTLGVVGLVLTGRNQLRTHTFFKKKPIGTGGANGVSPLQPLEADDTTPMGKEVDSNNRGGSDKLFQKESIPGEKLTMPEPSEGIESLIVYALSERKRTIEQSKKKVASGGEMAAEYQKIVDDYESVDPDVLAEDMRRYPGHYFNKLSAAGGNLDPVQVYRKRAEMPPQMPRTIIDALPVIDGQTPDLLGTMRELRDGLKKAAKSAPTLDVDRDAVDDDAAGQYNTRNRAITLKYHNDLDTVAHEVGHWAAETYGLLPDATATDTRAELARFAVHGTPSKGDTAQREGMAEYLRAWMVNPSEAAIQAPLFTAIFEKGVPAKVKAALRQYGDSVRRFEGATAMQKMAAGHRATALSQTEAKKIGRPWYPVWLAIRDWMGKGIGTPKTRPGAIPDKWDADKTTKAIFHATDKEAPQLANYLLQLRLVGKDPATMKPTDHWDYLRKSLRGIAGKIRDGVTTHGLPNSDGSYAHDEETGQPMNMGWLLEKAMTKEDVAAFLDKAHAYGSAQRTLELAERFTKKAEEEIEAYAQREADSAQNSYQKQAAVERVKKFAEERRTELRKQLSRITAAGGGLENATEVARKAIKEAQSDPDIKDMDEYLRRYRKWANWNLQYGVDSQLLSPSQAKTIRQANEFYIDWHRVFADDDGPIRLGEAVSGSSRTIHNPLESLLHATYSTVTRGDKNKTMNAFVAPLREKPKSGSEERSLADLGRQISKEKATLDFEQHHGYHDGTGQKQRIYTTQRTEQEINDEGEPIFDRDGEPIQTVKTEYWVFDPATEASMEAMRSDAGNDPWTNLSQGLVNFQRLAITSAPSFRLRVPVRDNIDRMLNSEVGSGVTDMFSNKFYTDPLTGEKIDLDRLYSQSGASMAGYNVRTREQAMADIFAHIEDMSKSGWSWVTPGGAWRAWQAVGETAENIGRKAEFYRAFKKAKEELHYSTQDAALYAMTHARGLLDTTESGRTIGRLNRVFLFLNAATKGLERMSKLSRESAKAYKNGDYAKGNKLAATVATRMAVWGGTLAAIRLLQLAMMDDDDQEEFLNQPAWKRDFAIILPDFGLGKLAIPKPYEWGFIGSGFERMADGIWSSARADDFAARGDKVREQKWRDHASRAFEDWEQSGIHATLPLKFDDVMGGGLAPIIEVGYNKSLFTGAPIISPWEADKSLELRKYKDDASFIGRNLSPVLAPLVGEKFGDPRAIDHLVRGYLGGWGSTATSKSIAEALRRSTGYSGETSPYSERDVSWVMEWATANGVSARKEFVTMRDAAKKSKGLTGEEQDAQLARMRQMAQALRRKIERGQVEPVKSR
jgi:hypothetical protein